MICPICKEQNPIKINSLVLLNLIDTITYHCTSCGVYYRDPLPNSKEVINYYSSRYFRYPEKIEKEMARIQGSFLIHYLHDYVKELQEIHYLEFGAGRGWVLSHLQNTDVIRSAVGFEPCEVSTQWGKENLGVDLRTGVLDEKQINQMHFEKPEINVISLIHVLEHLNNPAKIFSLFKTIINPHFLFLEVPDAEYEGPVMEIDTFPWSSMCQHFWSFSENSLRLLLESNGYQIIALTRDGDPHYWDHQKENIAQWNKYFNIQKKRYTDGNLRLGDIIRNNLTFVSGRFFSKMKSLLKSKYSRLDLPVIRILARTK